MKDDFRPSAARPNPTEDRGELDLTLLLEQHKKDIWEWKQKESQWIRDKNQLDGNKKIIEELSMKLAKMAKVNLDLKKRAQEAEGEVTIVKGIGMNSPEMKALQKEVEELKADLVRAKEDHQFDNLVHQKELESLRKK